MHIFIIIIILYNNNNSDLAYARISNKEGRMRKTLLCVFCLLWLLCCGPYVLVPPEIDLIPFEKVGLITFSLDEAESDLNTLATQRFLQEIMYAQRGVRILEIGTLDDVLHKIDRTKLDPESASLIQEKFGVTAYIYGQLQITEVKPKVDIIGSVQGALVQATFDISVTARMIATDTGVTLWTDSVLKEGNVGSMIMTRGGLPHFDLKDENKEYIQVMEDLIHYLTRDFRPTRQRM